MSSSDEVNTKIQELEALKKEAGRWKLGGTLAILAIVLICVFKIISGVTALAKKGPAQDKLVAGLKDGFNNQILPELKSAGKQAQEKATTALKAELDKLSDRLPEFSQKAQNEASKLAEELQEQAEKILDDTFQKMLDEREAKIREMYPDVTEATVTSAIANLQTAMEAELSKMVEEMFIEHLVVVDSIIHHIEMIKESEHTDLLDKGVPWEMGALVFEIVREEFEGKLEMP